MSSMHRAASDHDRQEGGDEDPWHLTALSNAISADFRRAVAAGVIACIGLALTSLAGGVFGSKTQRPPVAYFGSHDYIARVCAIVGTVLFFGFGVIAVRSAAKEIVKIVPARAGDDRRVGLRWICLVSGYLLVIFGTLTALNVSIARLAVGGAITGVILGIAAQQSLNNLFAGLVLLIVRPVSVGQRISLRSGPIGGPYTGEVEDMTLTYVRLATDRGSLLLPNSTLLTAVIGPPGVFDEDVPAAPAATPEAPTPPAPAPTPTPTPTPTPAPAPTHTPTLPPRDASKP